MANIPPPPPPPFQPVQPTTTHVATQETYNYAADLLINKKKSAEEVKNILLQQGFDFQTASTIINALQVEIAKQRKVRAKKDMMYGGGVCIVGLIITIISYSAAAKSGGTYIVTWGAVIFGALQFFRGLFNLAK